jgi:hypothetical protein
MKKTGLFASPVYKTSINKVIDFRRWMKLLRHENDKKRVSQKANQAVYLRPC